MLVLALAGLVTPWLLLALIFAVGTGQAFTAPTWQTPQPELVPPAERTQAISLGAVNQNLARARGHQRRDAVPDQRGDLPGGPGRHRLVARHPARVPPREHVGEAVRAGDRYIAASPGRA